jgi:hypothetical protein
MFSASTIFNNHARHHEQQLPSLRTHRSKPLEPHSDLDSSMTETVSKLTKRSTIFHRNQERLESHPMQAASSSTRSLDESSNEKEVVSTIFARNQRRAQRWN